MDENHVPRQLRSQYLYKGDGRVILTKSGKNSVFIDFSLSAKFNRFFIILGGGGWRIHWRNFFPVYPEGPNLDLQIGEKSGF